MTTIAFVQVANMAAWVARFTENRDLTNTANVLYSKYVSGEKFAAKEQCLDFKRMETECKKFVEKKK